MVPTTFVSMALMYSLLEAEPPNPSRPVMNLKDAVQMALAIQPQLKQSHAGTEAAYARADESRAALLPQLNLTGTYLRTTANFTARPGALPSTTAGAASAPTSWRSFNYYQLGATASQLLWDFNLTLDRWRSAKSNAEAAHFSELAVKLQAILAVQVAYFTAGARKDLVRVARETLDNQVRHLRQIEGFVRVGTRPEIDLAQARTDEANARVQLITAENNYETSKAQLNQAIGVEQSTDYDIADETFPPFREEDEPTDPLMQQALKARPEFATLDQQVRAQQLIVSSARGGYLPSISLGASFTDNGPALDSLTWNWSAQLQVQWSIFQGLLTSSQVREARANLVSVEAQRDILRQQVRLEVEQARLALRGAKAALVAAGEALENARLRLRLAERRYQTGVGDVIELGDAQVALTNAAAQEVGARFNLSVARAQLLKALGETS
ncbi:MAG TPA: TolC family protein [Myxococcaceae bacterium]|nr:TolC family protein [Myxococcaceae bacterium]